MVLGYDTERGLPTRIYRAPGEIRSDISRIKSSVDEMRDMINIRSLLMDILACDRKESPEDLIPELYDAIKEANEALLRFKALSEELSELEEELRETRCRLGM